MHVSTSSIASFQRLGLVQVDNLHISNRSGILALQASDLEMMIQYNDARFTTIKRAM